MAPPDQGLDTSGPIHLDNHDGHGNGPTTSKSLDPVHNINFMEEAAMPQNEVGGKTLSHESESEKVQLSNPTAWVNRLVGFLNTNFRRSLSSSQRKLSRTWRYLLHLS